MRPHQGLLVVPLSKGHARPDHERRETQVGITGPFGDDTGLGGLCRRPAPEGSRDQDLRAGLAFGRHQLEGPFDPLLDPVRVGRLPPHPHPQHRLPREIAVHIRDLQRIVRQRDRRLHRGPEGLAVVLEGMGTADLMPDRAFGWPGRFELERQVQQRQSLLDLVAAERQLCGAT